MKSSDLVEGCSVTDRKPEIVVVVCCELAIFTRPCCVSSSSYNRRDKEVGKLLKKCFKFANYFLFLIGVFDVICLML